MIKSIIYFTLETNTKCKYYTLSGQKYLYTAKYPCDDWDIYRLKIQLGPKMGIKTCRSQKFVVLALTLEKFF